jgi:hypothetical protein
MDNAAVKPTLVTVIACVPRTVTCTLPKSMSDRRNTL